MQSFLRKYVRLIAALFLALSPIMAPAPASAQSSGWEWCAVNWSADPTVCESLLNGNTGSVTYPNPSWVYFGHNSGYTGTPISGFTVTHSGVLEWWYTVDGTNWIDGNVTDYSPQTFTCPGCVGIKFSNQTGGAQIYQVTIELAATPTPTPVASSTPAPQSQACIPANLVATATPIPRITPTPFGTRTPAAPGTPTPVPTAAPSSWTSSANFLNGLSPWTTNGGVTWSNISGPDQQAGVAVLPFTSGATVNTAGDTQNYAPNDALILEHDGMPTPWRLAGDLRVSDGVPAGMHPYLQVFAWVDGGLGTGAWQLIGNRAVSQAWGTWTFSANVTQTRAIALRAVIGIADIDNPLGFIPQDYPDRSVWLDNIRVVAGADSNNPYVTGLPVCSALTGAGANISRKICTVQRVEVNVFQDCTTPTNWLDLGSWVGWIWCRLSRYFGWTDANTQQLRDMRERNAHYQPFAIASDAIDSLYVVQDSIQGFSALPSIADMGQPDFNNMLNAHPLDTPLSLPVPSLSPSSDPFAQSSSVCPQAFLNISTNFAPGACFAVYRIKALGIITVLQYVFNIACWLWLGKWVWGLLANRSEL